MFSQVCYNKNVIIRKGVIIIMKKITIFIISLFIFIVLIGCNGNSSTTTDTFVPTCGLEDCFTTTVAPTTQTTTTTQAPTTTHTPTTIAPTTIVPTTITTTESPTTEITTNYLESIVDSLVIEDLISENFYLPAELDAVTVSWSTLNVEFINISSNVTYYQEQFAYLVTVTRPDYESGDKAITITGLFEHNSEEVIKDYTLTIQKIPAQYYLDLDLQLLENSYLIEDNFVLPNLEHANYQNIIISTGIIEYLSYLDGEFTVTRPKNDVVGTISLDIVYGDAESNIVIDVTIKTIPIGTTYIEDFSWVSTSSTAYATSFTNTDEYGFSWSLFGRGGGLELPTANFALGNAADGSFVQVTATGGISSFSIDLVRAFTNTNLRSLELFINGISYGTFDISATSDIWQNFTVNNINVTGEVVIKIVSTSPSTRGAFYINNFTWTTYSGENIG